MKIPSIPLATIDPYFSLWLPGEKFTDMDTVHWTGYANILRGTAVIDGKPYRFLGRSKAPALEQVSLDVGFFSTRVVFEGAGIRLTATFTTPLLLSDLEILSRPVSFVEVRTEPLASAVKKSSKKAGAPKVSIRFEVSEQFCMDKTGDSKTSARKERYADGLSGMSIGSASPRVMERSGDDLRIEWGRFHLAVASDAVVTRSFREKDVLFLDKSFNSHEPARNPNKPGCNKYEDRADISFISVEAPVACGKNADGTLFLLAYDDSAASIQYFGKNLRSLWNKDGKSIKTAIAEAAAGYAVDRAKCDACAAEMAEDARKAGGDKYVELLAPAYRQTIAAHKLAVDEDGELLWISKENFSNGCAATVDVSYPSIPLFLLYCPELVKAMMRPIYRFAASVQWPYDFAPHDCGQYPLVNGQVYGLDRKTGTLLLEKQMPVEECGNMLVMEAAAALASNDASFAKSHLSTLRGWVKYLEKNGDDPGEQLCTDDFAGHLAHNCNLALKAIMGLASFGIILGMLGDKKGEALNIAKAKKMAAGWLKRAKNPDGSFRLAFDRPGSFSLKYNAVWDRVFNLGIFPKDTFKQEFKRYIAETLPYGVPLDSRKSYTKSDWIVWTASMADSRAMFNAMISPLIHFYETTPNLTPMTDWYWADTAHQRGFQARSVQGGLWMKVLESKKLARKR